MCKASRQLGIHRPRTKFLDVEKANLTYRKQRKHTMAQTRKITRRLLDLLGKILKEMRKMERKHQDVKLFTVREKQTLEIITKAYRQQRNHFESGDARESIPNRIVSVSKPYVRPIVRGKEAKNVEFGAKCNNILVDGISFIEKLSFNAFNEGSRLSHCIKMHKRLFGVDVKKVGGDTSYAGTANRDLCKELEIQTSFVKRGEALQRDERERLCETRTCESENDGDGRIIRDAERALLDASDQSQKEGNGDPLHLLRHPRRECSTAGGAVARAAISGGRIVEPLKRFRDGVLARGLRDESGKTTRNPGNEARTL